MPVPDDDLYFPLIKNLFFSDSCSAAVFVELYNGGGDYALFALTDNGYENLALNMADIRILLAQQRQIIIQYQEYYEGNGE